jgi:hypothetical protein
MPRMSQFMVGIRRSVRAIGFGIALILLQSVATAEHLSAAAAAAAGAPLDGPLGFLHICTARGLSLSPNGDAPNSPQDTFGQSCALCAMHYAIGSAVLPDIFAFPTPPFFDEGEVIVGKTVYFTSFPWRHIYARGPPVPSFV